MNERNKSRIVLLGGVGCTGKTTLAANILQTTGMPYFPVDYLMMGFVRGGLAKTFTSTDSSDQIARELWPVIQAMVMTSIENHHSMIFEGFQLLPKYMSQFDEKYTPHLVPLCLGLSDNYIDQHFSGAIKENRSRTERRDFSDERIESLKQQNSDMKRACARYQVPFFEAEHNYHAMTEVALDYVLSKLSEAS